MEMPTQPGKNWASRWDRGDSVVGDVFSEGVAGIGLPVGLGFSVEESIERGCRSALSVTVPPEISTMRSQAEKPSFVIDTKCEPADKSLDEGVSPISLWSTETLAPDGVDVTVMPPIPPICSRTGKLGVTP